MVTSGTMMLTVCLVSTPNKYVLNLEKCCYLSVIIVVFGQMEITHRMVEC